MNNMTKHELIELLEQMYCLGYSHAMSVVNSIAKPIDKIGNTDEFKNKMEKMLGEA